MWVIADESTTEMKGLEILSSEDSQRETIQT